MQAIGVNSDNGHRHLPNNRLQLTLLRGAPQRG